MLGTTKWGSGPSVAFLHEDAGPWVVGMVANNIWSLGGGSGGNNRTNQMLLNPIIGFHPADGWALSSSPEITANWIANGNKWTVPVGGGVSKVARLGEQPIKLELGAYYNAIAPAASSPLRGLRHRGWWRSPPPSQASSTVTPSTHSWPEP